MVKVLFLVTSHGKMGNLDRKTGWYLPEAAHPYHVFQAAGYEQVIVSPKGGKAPMDPSSYDAFKEEEVCKKFMESFQITADKLELDSKPLASYKQNYGDFDVMFIAGGHGPMWDTPDNPDVHEAVRTIYEKGGVVAAVCHGPCALVNIKLSDGEYLVKGKEVTCFTNDEEEAIKLTEAMPFLVESVLVEHGATFCRKANWQANVRVSGRLATGQNPNSATPLGEAIVKLLNQK